MNDRQTDSDALVALGNELKNARRAAGLSLNDVSVRLCISIRYLKAIEGGDPALIPGTTYMLGFVRSYARLLKLDADEFCNRVIDNMPKNALRPEYQAVGNIVEAPEYPIRYIVGAAAVVVLVYGGWYLYRNDFFSAPTPLPDEVAFISPDIEDAPTGAGGDDAPATDAPVIVLKATVASWVKIESAAGAVLVARLLAKDEVVAVAPDALLTTDNASGLQIGYQGDETSWQALGQALGAGGDALQAAVIDSLFLP